MLQSLQTFIISLTAKNHEVLLMWDANSLASDSDIALFLLTCSLTDLLSSRGIPSHASTSSRGRHIDFIHGTPLLLSAVRRGGILSFHQSPHSDHRALYVDLDEKLLFQDSSTDPTAPSHRLLRLSNPGQCAKYLGAVNEYLTSHKVFDRLNLLVHLNLSNNSLQEIQAAYESLDRDITAALLNDERRSA